MGRRLLVLVLGAIPAGCGQDCGNVNCGEGGAYVEWEEGMLPAGGLRLCVDGTCDEVRQPELLTKGRALISFNPVGGGADLGEKITVRLEVMADGRVLEGEGRRSRGCCPAYYLEVSADGQELVPQR